MATVLKIETAFSAISGETVAATGAYVSGDLVGTKLSFANVTRYGVLTGELRSVYVYDKSNQVANLDLVLFSANPTGTTFSDNAAFAIADADLDKVVGVIELLSHKSFTNNSVTRADNIGLPIKTASDMTLYGAIVSRGTPTYVANELGIQIAVYMD